MIATRAAMATAMLPLLLAGCGAGRGRVATTAAAPGDATVDWRRIATEADRARLRGWRGTWLAAVAAARAAEPAAVAAAGALFTPDDVLDRPVPPAGRYRCRVFKLGAKGAGMPDYLAYPWFECRIGVSARGEAHLVKLTGSQRQVGTFYAHDSQRAIFLGTLMLADEARAIPYGRDSQRDQAGWVARIGTERWRIALPQPAFEALLTVIELVPAA